jgi:hypothetical protein
LRDYVIQLLRPIVEKYFDWDSKTDDFTHNGLTGMDLLFWQLTGARHYPKYYDKLSMTKLCACFGGVFAIPWGNYNKYTAKIARHVNGIVKIFKYDRVRQWDSWRLWEAWAAGCCVLHVDFEKYGCVMPVMPKNGVHYVGLDLDHIDAFEKLIADEDQLKEIAHNGRKFALKHYSPESVAIYMVDKLDLHVEM